MVLPNRIQPDLAAHAFFGTLLCRANEVEAQARVWTWPSFGSLTRPLSGLSLGRLRYGPKQAHDGKRIAASSKYFRGIGLQCASANKQRRISSRSERMVM